MQSIHHRYIKQAQTAIQTDELQNRASAQQARAHSQKPRCLRDVSPTVAALQAACYLGYDTVYDHTKLPAFRRRMLAIFRVVQEETSSSETAFKVQPMYMASHPRRLSPHCASIIETKRLMRTNSYRSL